MGTGASLGEQAQVKCWWGPRGRGKGRGSWTATKLQNEGKGTLSINDKGMEREGIGKKHHMLN